MIPIEVFLLFAAVLFAIGAYGVMTKKNTIVVLMCIELMLNAANINFIVFSAFTTNVLGEVFVVMSISVAAAEVAVGIAILLNAYKVKGTIEADSLASMRW
ncbi:11-subunit complex, subunit K [Candidatus Methanoplasma termitum]|uniref:FpoK protein n=1 Tax=Candidatus Methanoplasma termitum TaxID=1577791 RepID=A0A0A7LDA7_9ARCH|nr:NADH-quinone oxidoreductase subunit NuoK [Candidatus Methanoplasma termitum]AIZ57120.1 11-subunit complex, subunit K [Candidatus Methanoplasma termitum]